MSCTERTARRAFARVDELRPAMAAHVVERAELAVLASDHDHRLTDDVGAQEVAGRGDVGFPADEAPTVERRCARVRPARPPRRRRRSGEGSGRACRSPLTDGRRTSTAHGRAERVRGRRGSHDPTLLSGAPCARVSERANERDRRVDHDGRRRPAGGDAVPAATATVRSRRSSRRCRTARTTSRRRTATRTSDSPTRPGSRSAVSTCAAPDRRAGRRPTSTRTPNAPTCGP